MTRHLCAVCVLGLSVAALSAQSLPPHSASAPQPLRLTLGIYSFKKRTEVWKQFQPVAVELSRLMSAQMRSAVVVELNVPPTYEQGVDDFVAGKIDFVRFGPASYVLAKQRAPQLQLLAAEREDSRQVGLIVVRDDSPIQTLAQLKGKKFAFGDSQSTIGRYLSQAELSVAGVSAGDLAAHDYLDRHDSVFKAVEIGDFDAGALHCETFQKLNANSAHKLRVIHAFDNAPKPWLARAGLDPAIARALTVSLLQLAEPAALKALKVPGFAPCTDADYDAVRKGMEKALRFAPIAPVPPAPSKEPAPAPNKG